MRKYFLIYSSCSQLFSPMVNTRLSPEEALKLWWGAIQRLNQPGLSVAEVKRLRLLLSALKAYVVRIIPVFERILEIEKRLLNVRRSLLEYYRTELAKATTEKERMRWQRIIEELGDVEDITHQDRLLLRLEENHRAELADFKSFCAAT